MSAFFRRELDVQEEISNILRNFIDKKFHDVLIKRIEKEYDRGLKPRRADIAILKDDGIPLMIIETKKEKNGTKDKKIKFIVSSNEVLGQVFAYAAILKKNGIYVPFVATANDSQIMVFEVPEDIDKHVNREAIEKRDYGKVLTEDYIYNELRAKYLLLHKQIRFTEDFLADIVDTITGIYTKKYKVEEKRQGLHWILIEDLRGFVDFLTRFILDAIQYNKNIQKLIDEYAKSKGYKPSYEQLAREMAYVLMNKIVFYKVLEQHYGLKRLEPLYSKGYVKTVSEYLKKLNELFEGAVKITGDFEAIFKTGIYDNIDIVENEEVLKAFDWIIGLIDHYSIDKFGDLVGYVYEDLIPDEERHTLGQFYTPKPIAELIVKWTVRDPDDKVLDPGCGSGTFLIEAYKRLAELKLKKPFKDIRFVPKDVHKQILDQLVGIDINEFPAHLTAMNLAMRNPKVPSTNLNVIREDYFSIIPSQKVLLPYKAKTVEGEKPVEIVFKDFDTVVGNPPYTRWIEIPESTKNLIITQYRDVITKYGLTPQVSRGVEIGIYVYWIIHSTNFLKEGGRLGMIISDSWLQTEYGKDFFRYLLDNYKVHAIIDISARVFPVPLIGTCIVLLERSSNATERNSNKTIFMYLDLTKGSLEVDKILDVIEKKEASSFQGIVKVYKQGDLYWYEGRLINLLFSADEILNRIKENPLIIKLTTYFEPNRSNLLWSYWALKHGKRPDVGGEEFFYLTEEDIKSYNVPREYLYPLLPSSNYMKFFTFTEDDWKIIRDDGNECYLFLAHKPKNELPEAVRKYIEHGEKDENQGGITITKGKNKGKAVMYSAASQARKENKKYFYDWYDLGGVLESPIYITYGARYWMRFVLSKFNCALDHRILALIPKQGVKLDEAELKALLAYLNSSFSQLQAELMGRTAGGVALLELDVKPLNDYLILDVKRLPRDKVERLAQLFDKLDEEARKLGGADSVENVFGSELAKELTGKEVKSGIEGLFNTVIKEIDYEIAKILGLEDSVEAIRSLVIDIMRRRLARAGESKHSAIKGSEEATELEKPKKDKKSKGITWGLDEWM